MPAPPQSGCRLQFTNKVGMREGKKGGVGVREVKETRC